MISVKKLFTLAPKHRYRKACQALELMETLLRSRCVPETVLEPRCVPKADLSGQSRSRSPEEINLTLEPEADPLPETLIWLRDFCLACVSDKDAGSTIRALAADFGTSLTRMPEVAGSPAELPKAIGLELIRFVNTLRRSLEAEFGSAPADWDFFAPLGCFSHERTYFKGVKVFLEDIRSPFNVGSIFRTADACGFEEVLLSGLSASPLHPRSLRTAMGATDVVPWRSMTLAELAASKTAIIALELGSESIDSFVFPERGVVVLGSEELGISPEARSICTAAVSIPMLGAKGSLNVGVAFGILANAWRAWLMSHGINPVQDSRGSEK